MLVKEYITLFLNQMNIEKCFGLSGANIEDLLLEIYQNNPNKFILSKSEYSAATMAMGYYLATKKVTTVHTTSGPGIFNTIPVLAEAFTAQIPFVLISGLTPNEHEGIGGFQDCSGKNGTLNILNTIKTVTEYAAIISDPENIINELEKAYQIATESKRPVALLIPKNIFNKKISDSKPIISNEPKSFLAIDINKYERPLIVLGEHLIHLKDKSSLDKLTAQMHFKFVTTPNAKGLIDPQASNYLGVCGIMGSEVDNLRDNDFKTIILLGTNFDLTSRFGLDHELVNKKIVFINHSDTNLENIFPNLVIEKHIANLDFIHFSSLEDNTTPNTLSKRNRQDNLISKSLFSIEQKMKNENIFCDAGNVGAFAINEMNINNNQLFYCSLGMGGMGNSIGMSLGASLGNNQRSIAIMGDGSFYFFGLEIHTAVQYQIPVTFIIYNNNSHAMCNTREQVFLNAESSINNFQQSFLGKGFDSIFPGLKTFDVNTLDAFDSALETCLNSKMPNIISINIDKNIFPPFKTFKPKDIK